MTHLSTHVLDAVTGRPVTDMAVTLTDADDNVLAEPSTDGDGRITELAGGELSACTGYASTPQRISLGRASPPSIRRSSSPSKSSIPRGTTCRCSCRRMPIRPTEAVETCPASSGARTSTARPRAINVSTCLRGDFTAAHVTGDQSDVLPTDTQKQTACAYAKEKGLVSIED